MTDQESKNKLSRRDFLRSGMAAGAVGALGVGVGREMGKSEKDIRSGFVETLKDKKLGHAARRMTTAALAAQTIESSEYPVANKDYKGPPTIYDVGDSRMTLLHFSQRHPDLLEKKQESFPMHLDEWRFSVLGTTEETEGVKIDIKIPGEYHLQRGVPTPETIYYVEVECTTGGEKHNACVFDTYPQTAAEPELSFDFTQFHLRACLTEDGKEPYLLLSPKEVGDTYALPLPQEGGNFKLRMQPENTILVKAEDGTENEVPLSSIELPEHNQ